MTAQIIYGTDFRARREREAAELEMAELEMAIAVATDAVYVGVDLASGPDFTVYAPSQIVAPEKDPA